MLKRVLSVTSMCLMLMLLLSVMQGGLFNLTANAATSGYYTYTVSDGKATITSCSWSISGDITIPVTLGGYPVTGIGDRSFSERSGLTSIIIPNGITYIGAEAFSYCRNLKSVTIPNSLTSIGNHAFRGCSGLANIVVPNHGITQIGQWAFCGCSSLTSFVIPESVNNISDFMFYECSSLSNITIPKSVTSIGADAFSWCSSLTSITIPDGITTISNHMFYHCSGLTSITIPDSVTSISDYAFLGCTSLQSVTIPASVKLVDRVAFSDCAELKEVYYGGTFFDAKEIDIKSGNQALTDAEWHYAVCNENEHNFTINGGFTCDRCAYSKAPGAPIVEVVGIDSVTLTAVDGFEYSSDGINWQNNNVFEGLSIGKTYTFYQRVKESSISFVGQASDGVAVALESPIESIVLEDIILYWGLDTYGEEEDICYSWKPQISQVTLKDGTPAKIDTDGSILYDDQWYWVETDEDESQWKVGNTYTVTGTLLGVSATFEITIEEYPIQSIDVIRMPNKLEYITKECFDYTGMVLQIRYTDGSSEELHFTENVLASHYYAHAEKIDRYWELDGCTYIVFEEAGQQMATIKLFDHTCEIPVTVEENNVESISIREDANKNLIITAHRSDNTSYDMTVLDMEYLWISGAVVTDKGTFIGRIEGEEWEPTWSIKMMGLYSDSITDCEWYKRIDYFYAFQMRAREYGLNSYDGRVTANNIDAIIQVAISMTDSMWGEDKILEETEDYWVFSGEDVVSVVRKVFNIDAIDMELSENYDPETDTYIYFEAVVEPSRKLFATQSCYENGKWFVRASAYIEGVNVSKIVTTEFELDEDFRIVRVNVVKGNNPFKPSTIIFKNWDGTILSSEEYYYGDEIKVPENPVRASSGGIAYTFAGWDKYIMGCAGDAVYTATYEEHHHTYASELVMPTCSTQGYTVYTCVCGDTYKDNYVEAFGHSGDLWFEIVPSTCTTDGLKARICSVCGATETQVIAAPGHSNTSVVTPPTCEDKGYTTNTCVACGLVTVTDYVDATGHDYSTVEIAPTCTEKGSATKTCATCGDVVIEEIAAKGHGWSAWIQTAAPSCTAEGSRVRFCNCGARETEVLPKLPHSFEDDICTVCGKKTVDLKITAVTLRPEAAGLYFTGSFEVAEDVSVVRQGIVVSVYSSLPVADGSDPNSLWSAGTTSVMVKNILKANLKDTSNQNRAAMSIYARAYVELADGTYVYSDVATVNLQEVVEAADAQWATLNNIQKEAFLAMYKKFQVILQAWSIPNVKKI